MEDILFGYSEEPIFTMYDEQAERDAAFDMAMEDDWDED